MNSLYRYAGLVIIGLALGFTGTIVFAGHGNKAESAITVKSASAQTNQPQNQKQSQDKNAKKTEKAGKTVPVEAQIFQKKGCIRCHSVEAYNINAGKAGPDLSNMYNEIQDRTGQTLEQFLHKPNNGVMSAVLSSQIKLSDADIQKIVKALKDSAK